MKRLPLFLTALLVLFNGAYSQPNLKDIIKRQSQIAGELRNPVEGFARRISGEEIAYTSPRQDCPNALLVRATDGKMSIVWETPAINVSGDVKEIQVFLITAMSLQGYSTKAVDPGFTVSINNKPYFHFKNSQGENWSVNGPGGSSMLFQTVFKDQVGDAFGYSRIILPVSQVEPGKPLKINITGDASDTRHWFMGFQCTDALDWFHRKTQIETWFEIHLAKSGDKFNGTIDAADNWAGQPVEISGNSGKSQKLALIKQNNQALASFVIPSGTTGFSIKGPGGLAINDISINTSSKKSIIQSDRLLSWQVGADENGNPIIQGQVATSSVANDLKRIAGSAFSRGSMLIMASSHQDIAWMDSPQACVENRDNLLITPALKKLEDNPGYYNDMEDILMLREYLARHPEKKDLIYRLTKEGRLTWGASYMQPYEEMYFGEPLIRQFYLGRKWFKDQFPGCDARIYWNVDVPGRTLQMPQILAKSGVPYMIISRQDKGLFNWLSPDGSKVLTYSSDHYYNSYVNLKKGFFESVKHFADLSDFWGKYYQNTDKKPVMPILSDADMAVPDSYFDYIETWNSLRDSSLRLPELIHSTAEKFLDESVATGIDFPAIQGERPAVWLYIHGPSHFEALKAGRSAGRLLPAAEKMASFRSLISGNWEQYPGEKLTKAWESAIYPDHGWGGKNGDITDQTFLDKFREADQIAKEIIRETTEDIAGNIGFDKKGLPLVVFNSLSWERTDPVEVRLTFDDKVNKGVSLLNEQGKPIAFQVSGPVDYYPSGYLKSATVSFIADHVPSLGYQTYYVVPGKKIVSAARSMPCNEVIDSKYYKIQLGNGGIESLFDKDLQREIFKTDQFKGGDLFSMHSFGNGAGEFSDIQQPDMEGFEIHGVGSTWNVIESGPVKMVIEGYGEMKHNKARITWTIYQDLKRIDVRADLIDWDGTAYREFRLAFPARLQNPEITYEVPFGVVRVGKDELAQPAGERYNTLCKDIHPRGINNWISASDSEIGLTVASGVAVWDYVNMTNLSTDATLLQPILLASRQSCHGEGPLYHQKGSHSMEFSLFTHLPGWQNGYHQALQANEKLMTAFNPLMKSGSLPSRISFITVDDQNSIVSTVKKAEDGNGMVFRLYDQEGRDRTVNVGLFWAPQSVEQTNMIEENPKSLKKEEKGVTLKLGHHAIETYKIKFW